MTVSYQLLVPVSWINMARVCWSGPVIWAAR